MPRMLFNPFTGDFDYVLRPGEGQVVGELPAGPINGVNKVFTTAAKFLEDSLRVYLNGQRLTVGALKDYVVSESGGSGTGFDTMTLATAPISGAKPDVIIVDYTER